MNIRSSKRYCNTASNHRTAPVTLIPHTTVALDTHVDMLYITARASLTLDQMHDKLPPGITLIQAEDFKTWLVDVQVVDSNPLYLGETYRLKFAFSPQYPIEVFTFPAPNTQLYIFSQLGMLT
jgi:hypothetical protein